MRARLRLVNLLLVAGLASVAWMQAPGAQPRAHRFQEVGPGVYAAMATGTVNTGSNSTVIVNDEDVIVVDSHITPAAARALVDDIATLTPKPVRFVIDTHYHFDHAHGNQVFGPDVQIIGHEFVRRMLLTNVLEQRTYRSFTDPVPGQVEALRRQVAAEADPARKQQLEGRLRVQQAYAEAIKEIRPTPPNLTYQTQMTLYRGSREIRLLFLGRGHTAGDTVVFLPKERILSTGDLIGASISFMYMGDAFVNEWADTIDKVLQLEFDTIIPGHGDPFTDKNRLRFYQAYLRDLWTQAVELKAQGVAPDEAAKRIDMTRHKANLPQVQAPGVDPRAVVRIYDVLEGREEPQ